MCGIAGIIKFDGEKVDPHKLKLMTDSLKHRGPDGEGFWINKRGNVGFGHRRLSILDLSESGSQPMHYANNRYSITYNGEIYNYLELRDILKSKSYQFKSDTDTEVVLAAFHLWGEECLSRFDGMFAFAIWDEKEQKLFCARDRFGEKPFYYYKDQNQLIFASEIKALWAFGLTKEVNHQMMFNFLYYGSESNPCNLSETFYDNIKLLEHATSLSMNSDNRINLNKYFTINFKDIDHSISNKQAKSKFSELFYNSISHRLRSDVTVGSSLSGGLDSSTIVSIINQLKVKPKLSQKVFSAYFSGFEKNEKKYIDLLSKRYDLNSYFVDLGNENYSDVIEKVLHAQDEPIASLSVLAQYKVMQLAHKNDVKVLLDGQGADEILGGYHWHFNSYFEELFFKNKLQWKSQYNCYKRLHEGNSINRLRVSSAYKYYLKSYLPFLPRMLEMLRYQEKKSNIEHREYYETYKKYKFKYDLNFRSLNEELHYNTFGGPLQSLLKYSDRNSMANSVEVRLPFLSHKLVEYMFKLPSTFKINKGWTKWLLRESFSNLLPDEIAWRKEKVGYEPPKNTNIFDNKFDLVKRFYSYT